MALVEKRQCFFPSKLGDLLTAVRKPLKAVFKVTAKPDGLEFYRVYTGKHRSPTFRLREFPLGDIPMTTGVRGPPATRWKHQLLEDNTTCLAMSFEDLDEVLEEINGLIFAQSTLCGVTRAPVINAWNREIIDAADCVGKAALERAQRRGRQSLK